MLDTDGSLRLLRRAVAADPEFFPAVMAYQLAIAFHADLRDEYRRAVGAGSSAFQQCVAIILAAPTGYQAAATAGLLALERDHRGSACSAAYLGYNAAEMTPARVWNVRGLGYISRALDLAPEAAELWRRRAALFMAAGYPDTARAAVLEGLQRAPTAMHRVPYYQLYISVLAATQDSGRVRELERALAAAVVRDGRPGVRFVHPDYVRYLDPAAARQPPWERAGRERIRLASQERSGWHEWGARRSLGVALSDAGRPAEALEQLDRTVRFADSIGSPLLQVDAYRFRGRTYAKLGRFAEAERDLRQAIAAGARLRDPYLLAEAYHNLAHVFEGMGRMADAAHVVDRFIELTRPLQHAQPRMMSLHDAGIIRWKAGWPAAANAAFDEMVRVVDEQERGYYWAGEHFEQIGDLQHALHYFQRGAELDWRERSLNLGGTVRVLQALGRLDSAQAAARAHDSVLSNQLDVPLLPPLLAAAGHTEEALEIARSWARRQVAQGNLQGAAMASNGLADLLLRAGQPRQSLAEAAAAESLARRANLTEELIRARRVQGESRVRLGDAGGLAQLRDAAALATAHPSAEGGLLTQLALGDGNAALGHTREALEAYDRGAREVERVAGRLTLDLDRARFRDHQLAAFDGALDLLLRSPATPDRFAKLLAWSQRRKAASLGLAVGLWRATGNDGPATLRGDALQQRLPARSGLLDYLTVRDRSAVLLVTAAGQRLIELPLGPDSLRRLVDQLRAPLTKAYAGRLDLARAGYDLQVAHALYQAVLAPVEPALEGIERLLVVPDGPLHYVPFDALVRTLPPASAGVQEAGYAIDRYDIELLPSAQFLGTAGATRPRAGPGRVLVITHEAPGAAQEADAIRAAWPARAVTVLAGDAASETAFRGARAYDVLHFATHAEADDREPLASHLRLEPDELNDGFLHLGEIAAQRHRAQLVVLSACETFSGVLYRGEGLMGLARAFIISGAGAVIATEWPAGPAAAELMGEFYHQLARGSQPSEALREAKLVLRRRPGTSHPFYWAGFVLLRGAAGVGARAE